MIKQIGYIKHYCATRRMSHWNSKKSYELKDRLDKNFDLKDGIPIVKITGEKLELSKLGSIQFQHPVNSWYNLEIFNKDEFVTHLLNGTIKRNNSDKLSSIKDAEVSCYGLLKKQSYAWRVEVFSSLEELQERAKGRRQKPIITDGKLLLQNKLRQRAEENGL